MIERDYILRMIQQFTIVLTRVMKLQEETRYTQALDAIAAAYVEIFGMTTELMAAFDSSTLSRLLGHYEKIKVAASLLRAEADLHMQLGEARQAQACYQRSFELFLDAAHTRIAGCKECLLAAEELALLLDSEKRVAPKYYALLQKLRAESQ